MNHLRKCFPSVLVSLERGAQERNNVEAAGLASFIKKYEFVATLYMFSDVLQPLACLSRAFQKKDIDFTMVKPLVVGTKAAVGEFFQSVPAAVGDLQQCVGDLQQYGVQQPSGSMADRFKHNVYEKYLGTLSEHITARFPDYWPAGRI